MKTTVRVIVSILIFVLASASVANIHSRAVQLHADGGWQTWGISIGMAVSFALFAYMLIAFKKTFFLLAAIFGAIVTSVLQTGMYLTLGSDWATALVFGFGGPVLEALLAMSEHYMDEPTGRKAASVFDWSRIGNAIASRIERPAQPGDATVMTPVAQPPTLPQPDAPPAVTVAQRRDELLRLLNDIELPDEINKAQLGRLLGVSRTQVGKDIESLIDAGRLSVNGKVKVLA